MFAKLKQQKIFSTSLLVFTLSVCVLIGTMVGTSECSSMPEVGGEAAVYFDPKEADSIAAALRRIAAMNPEERQQRIQRGIEHARPGALEHR